MFEENLFHLALEQPAAERGAFLDKMCGDDPALRQRVEALLHAHENPDDFLAPQPRAPQEQTVDEPRLAERPGSRVGPYKLLQQIGEGGMGVVFMAEQTEPVRRRVALKVIKPGMDTRQVVARFEAERQALALMDHPNIAKVLDAGATDSGLPYFVMELVKGDPITKYCDEHRLTPQQRLELFIPVCQAVQHAHQKGIIHRDLKSSNVLIALYDGKPVPKVIDFGVAKAVGGGLTDKTLFTDFGAVVGTLEYMSPEQAEPNQLDIDTRSDLYALGVLLYELLTGTTPFERKRLRAAALLECLRIIREEEPQKPSTRLSTAEQLPSVAANRGLEPKKLTGVVRGDLDWIVMKCLEKDRNRRYETANGLAMDVQRYLADEPVLASSPSATYRLRKFARRHKAGLLTTMAATLVLLLAAGGIGWVLWDRAARDTARRVDLAGRMVDTEKAVLPALAKADQLSEQAAAMPLESSKEADAALVVWQQASDALGQAEAALRAGVSDELLGQQVEKSLGRIAQATERAEQRRSQALRREKLFRDLDDARMALATNKEGHFDFAGAAARYAAAFAAFGLEVQPGQSEVLAQRFRDEEPAVRDALIVALDYWAYCERTSLKADLIAIARAADQDAWRQEYRRAVAERDVAALVRLSGEARHLMLPPTSLDRLAHALFESDRRAEAQDLLRWARGLHPTDFWIALNLGTYLEQESASVAVDLEERIGCYRVAVALRPDASAAHYMIGVALYGKNQLDDAIAEYNKAIALDPKFAPAHNNLGIALYVKNQLDDAIAEYNKAIALNPKDAGAHGNLGAALAAKKQLDDAIVEYHKAIALDPKLASAHGGLGIALKAKNQLDDAITELQEAIDLKPEDASAHCNLGLALKAKNQLDDAIAEYHKAIALDPKFASAHGSLGTALAAKNQIDDAIAEFHKAIALDPKDALAHCNLGSALHDKNQLDDAIAEYHKAIALDPKFALTHYSLGNALKAKGQTNDAIAEFHKAIALDPKFAPSHINLGDALAATNQLDAAIAEFHKAIALDPKDPGAHNNLGNILQDKNRLDDAIAEYHKAIVLDPKHTNAYGALGQALLRKGLFEDARTNTQKTLDLLPEKDQRRQFALRQRDQCDALLALEAKLPDVLAGKAQPKDNRERLGLIQVCRLQQRHAAAAKLYGDAFIADGKLADDLNAFHRYNAACSAAMAASGQGTDADKLDDQERTRLRKQALEWLRADLDLWNKRLPDAKPPDRQARLQALMHWQDDADLAGIRDKDAVAKLPAEEQETCKQLWADVAEVLKKAQEKPK
jgi:tetratricopeptide (TPR) repeat protein/serine/threonine protein kinase